MKTTEILLFASKELFRREPDRAGELWWRFIGQDKYWSVLDWYYTLKVRNEL